MNVRVRNCRRGPILMIVLLTAIWPLATVANMANPYQPGQPVGEPWGSVGSIAIEHEKLDIDLRPLAQVNSALVTASYQVRNDQASRTLDLMFVAAALSAGASTSTSVWLDDRPVMSLVAKPDVLPASWRPPATTPSLNGQPPLHYLVGQTGAIFFTLSLSTGAHQITVRYPARATSYSGDSPARYWQLGYVLAPARQWASFGGLDVTVDLPHDWRASSSPELSRTGDTLTGSFDQIPADSLALTAQYPVQPEASVSHGVWLAILVAALLVIGLLGLWLHRRRRSIWLVAPLSFLFVFVWVVIFLSEPAPGLGSVPSTQTAWTYGYGAGPSGMILLAPLLLPFELIVMAIFARRARRKTPIAQT